MSMAKLKKALAGLVLDQPFFGALALKLRVIEDPTCDTAWVNGETLGFNPEFIANMPIPKIKGLLAHEVMHCAMAHHVRRGNRDSKKWNYAGDYVINALLEEAGFDLPENGLINPAFKDQSTEHVYATLPDFPKDGEGNGSADPGGCGEVRDAPGSTESEAIRKEQENDWKTAVGQAAQAAKMMGKLPGNMERFAEDLLDSKVDWREKLRHFMTEPAKDDYSWRRPNRRHIAQGLYLPDLDGEKLGDVVFAIDTSGSISNDELQQFCSEVNAVLEDCSPAKVHVVYVDSKVAGSEEFTPDEYPVHMEAKGGGGTDFVPAFNWVTQENIEPACLVYLTDMYCNSFPNPPDYPVLWVSTSNRTDAPFGEVVEMIIEG